MMSRAKYFSLYRSPNIVIVPSKSVINPPPLKKAKTDSKTIREHNENNSSVSQRDQIQDKTQNTNPYNKHEESLNNQCSESNNPLASIKKISSSPGEIKSSTTRTENQTNEKWITNNYKPVKSNSCTKKETSTRNFNKSSSDNNTTNSTSYTNKNIKLHNNISEQNNSLTYAPVVNKFFSETELNCDNNTNVKCEKLTIGNVMANNSDIGSKCYMTKTNCEKPVNNPPTTFKSENKYNPHNDADISKKKEINSMHILPECKSIYGNKRKQSVSKSENKLMKSTANVTEDTEELNKNLNHMHSVKDSCTVTGRKRICESIMEKSKVKRQKESNQDVRRYNKMKSKPSKKIKIVINVIYNNLQKNKDFQKKDLSESKNVEFDEIHNVDLSFLDNFDIDEVVESLNSCNEEVFNSEKNRKEQIKNKGYNNSIKEASNSSFVIKVGRNIAEYSKVRKSGKENENEHISSLRHTSRYLNGIKPNIAPNPRNRSLPLGNIIPKNTTNNSNNIKCEIDNKDSTDKATKTLQQESNNLNQTKVNHSTCEDLNATSKNSIIFRSFLKNEKLSTEGSKEILKNIDSIEINDKQEYNLNINSINQANKTEKSYIASHSSSRNKFITKFEEFLAEDLEIKMCDNFKKKYSVAVSHCGKFSKIFKCINSSGQHYAVKILHNESDRYKKGMRKVNMLKQLQKDIPLQNLSCTFLISSFQLKGYWCFMMDYYPVNLQQVLQDRRKSFHIDQTRQLGIQLVEAVIILRNNNIIHSDIKPSHILFNSKIDKLKLCGFDEAYHHHYSNNLSANSGTVNYRSPEIILGYSNGFTIDIWSTALVIYEMATNNMLFPGNINNDVLFKQMCMFGNLPIDMIKESRFRNEHFNGTAFIKSSGVGAQDKIRINHFAKRGKISSSIFCAYARDWDKIRAEEQKKDASKLQILCSLLDKMLVLHPRNRLTIEYVYANPFFLRIY